MDTATWIFLLMVAGIVLLVAELFLPTGGVLGVLGGASIVGGIGLCFVVNQWAGLILLLLAGVSSPFIAAGAMKVWPKTPVGRRIVLQPVESRLQPPLIRLGAVGVALSELRPMGTCEFGDQRVEVRSDMGIISPGTKVKVINIDAGRLIVRPAEAQQTFDSPQQQIT